LAQAASNESCMAMSRQSPRPVSARRSSAISTPDRPCNALATSAIGGVYTLNSIAAVVIGGTSLAGGAGSAIGSIFGALVLRTIGDLLFVFDLEPLWQPLFQGVILLVAVSLGALQLLKVSDRLELFR